MPKRHPMHKTYHYKIGIPTYAVKKLDADHLLGKTINPFSRYNNVNITKVMEAPYGCTMDFHGASMF